MDHSLSPAIQIIISAVVLIALYLISTWNFLLFHAIVEVAGVAVAFAIFFLVWNTRRLITSTFFLIVGISFLFTGIIDLLHTLVYDGMGVFPGINPDPATQLWIAARYFQSITFLIATFFTSRSLTPERKYDAEIIFAVFTAVTGFLLASIFVWDIFPACFIEGSGLTLFKIASEYLISAILVATVIAIYVKRASFSDDVWKYLIAAQVFLIFGELAFTSYISPFGFMNMLGHLFRLVSVYLFYRVFMVVGLKRPYDLMFRELRQSRDALEGSKKRYDVTLNAVNDGLWDWDIRTGETVFSDQYYIQLGYDPGEFPATYQSWQHLIYPGDLQKAEAVLGQRLRDGAEFDVDLRMKTRSGTWKWVNARGKVIEWDESGKPARMVGTHHDITDRKTAEEALRESEERYRILTDYAFDGVLIQDFSGKILFSNPAIRKMIGIEDAALVTGRNALEFVAPEFHETVMRDLQNVLSGKGGYIQTYRARTPDGKELWFESIGTMIQYQGAPANIVALRNVTDRRRAEGALFEANKKLNLLSSITRHDIKNQLAALKGFIELSEISVNKPDKLAKFFAKEKKIADTIERQITFTRDYETMGVKAPLWQNVQDLITLTASSLPAREVRIEMDRPDLEIFADPLLEKVFYNLIDNALRYGGDRMTAIRISSHESGQGLVLIFADDGVGISYADKGRLFTKGFGKNTGLGLFLSREILLITGITIQETGEPGKGARFEITVPKGAYRFVPPAEA